MSVKKPKINEGNEKLLKRSEWVGPEDLQGEEKVLKSPIMKKAFNEILRQYKTNKKIAFLSLCSKKRPYYKSYKWKRLMKDFEINYEVEIDLLVCSNGGIVPAVFWESYPYLTYNAPREKDFDNLYNEVLSERIYEFLTTFKYDYIIADFRPTQRNRKPTEEVLKKLKEEGFIKDYFVSPTLKTFEIMKKVGPVGIEYDGYSSVSRMYPTFHPYSYYELNQKIPEFVDKVIKEYPHLKKERINLDEAF